MADTGVPIRLTASLPRYQTLSQALHPAAWEMDDPKPGVSTSSLPEQARCWRDRFGGIDWPSSPRSVFVVCTLLLLCLWGAALSSAIIERRGALDWSQRMLNALSQSYVHYAAAVDALNIDKGPSHALASPQERLLLDGFRATFKLPAGMELRLLGTGGKVVAGDQRLYSEATGWLVSRAVVPGTPIVAETSFSRDRALAGWRQTNLVRIALLVLVTVIVSMAAFFAYTVTRRRDTTVRRWRALFNHPLDQNFVLESQPEDPAGYSWRIVDQNSAGVAFLAQLGEEYRGELFSKNFPKWARARINEENALAARDRTSRTYVLVSPDRKQSYAITAVPVVSDPTQVQHVILRLRDISEREQHDVELEDAISAAEAASRAKSAILANTSHELRTPLNAIIGYSELMQQGIGGGLTPQQEEYLQIIHRSGHHLLEIISDILDLAKIESGRFELRDDIVNVEETIAECISLVQQRANDKGLALHVRSKKAPQIRADAMRLRQILVNLLSNAVKFTERGSVTISTSQTDAGGVCIKVADTGVGMDAEELALAMEAFRQVEHGKARQQEGTGLGLPLAKKLTIMHGGTFVVKSTKGVGTEVVISFGPDRVIARPAVAAVV